jgi:hypothetical protein
MHFTVGGRRGIRVAFLSLAWHSLVRRILLFSDRLLYSFLNNFRNVCQMCTSEKLLEYDLP